MLNSQETLQIVGRMLEKYDITSLDSNFTSLSSEEEQLLNNLLSNYNLKNDLKLTLILKMFSSYLNLLSSDYKVDRNTSKNLNEIIKSVQFNEIELFLPCKHVEWILLEIGKKLLSISEKNKEVIVFVDNILETTTDLFKIVDNDYGIAITNYLLAYKWFLAGNKDKASRLLEMVAHIFKNPILVMEAQYYGALLNYPTNLRRSINLLENCLLLFQKYSTELAQSTISFDRLENELNKLRREFIIREHENEDKSFLSKP